MMRFALRLFKADSNVLKLFYDDKMEKHKNGRMVCNNLRIKL